MFKCLDCGYEFREPKETVENVGEYMGTPAYQPLSVCPACGSPDIGEMSKCEACGGFITEGDYCPECIRLRNDAITAAFLSVEEWTGCGYEAAKRLLNTYFEED